MATSEGVTAQVETGDGDDRSVVVGLRLDRLRMAIGDDLEQLVASEQVRMLNAVHAHGGARFVLQYVVDPGSPVPDEMLDVHLLAVVPAGSDAATPERIEELVDDLEDLLQSHNRWYHFSRITDTAALAAAVDPFEAGHVAEVLRREEELSTALLRRGMGFAKDIDVSAGDQFWGFSLLNGAEVDWQRLIELLLLQEEQVCLRVVAAPTALTTEEKVALGELHQNRPANHPFGPLDEAAKFTLDAMAFNGPNFETQILLASPGRLSPALVEGTAALISPPLRSPLTSGALVGGYHVDRNVETAAFATSLVRTHGLGDDSWFAPPELRRLRRVMGTWELNSAFRIPVAPAASFPGMRVARTPAPPSHLVALPDDGRVLGVVESASAAQPLRLSEVDRFRHTYVLGQTGTGKSTLLLNLITQDIVAGEGVALIDPHGDLVEAVLAAIPPERADDVVLIDPTDPDAVVGINILEAETPEQAEYLVSDLCEFFQQMFDPHNQGFVGPRFQSWLRQGCNTVSALPWGGTICDVPRVYTDKKFAAFCLQYVTDPVVREFWHGEMAKTSDHTMSEMLGWFTSKFMPFTTDRMVRSVVGQPRSSFSFRNAMDERKIVLMRLSKGLMGEFNASVLGFVVFAKLWSTALNRARQPEADRVPFHIYVDEFQNMTTTSLPAILSEARKFRVSLTLANQFFGQVDEKVRESIVGNVGSKIVFRVGSADATMWSEAHGETRYSSEHLRLLPNYLAIANLLVNGEPLEPILAETLPAEEGEAAAAEHARTRSREQFAVPRAKLDKLHEALMLEYADGKVGMMVEHMYPAG